MSDEKDSPGHPEEPVSATSEASMPMRMQLFSTWEVRKVPANCVSRLCTLTVTRLEVVRCIEVGLGRVVLAVSMKTPHRFLRSNEIRLPPSGVLDIPLQLTFALQYPHFLKRGGNVLQIRLQRRKRYRNRPLGGYKTLVVGKVDMSQVLQHSYQGEVRLYAEKVADHVAVVGVGSLTSTAVFIEPPSLLAEVSSEEDEDDIFSDELVERGSDSDSGDNEQPPFGVRSGKSKDRFKRPAAVLRLLGLRGRPAKGRVELMSELELRGEDRESAVTFASSISDSEEEEDELAGGTPPHPTLSPFFTSEHCSMVSLPTTARSAEVVSSHGETGLTRKYGSLERAISTGMESPVFVMGESVLSHEWDLQRGRVWCVGEDSPGAQAVLGGLERDQEVAVGIKGEEGRVSTLQSLITAVQRKWHECVPFHVVLVGGDELVSAAAQALVATYTSDLPPDRLTFSIVPTVTGLVSARVCSLDEDFAATFPLDGQWLGALQDSVDLLLQYVQAAVHTTQLPLAQAGLQIASTDGGLALEPCTVPFMCNLSVGMLDIEGEGATSNLPTSPTSSSSGDSPELVVEYWTGKKESQKASLKVRSIMISCAGQLLNVTALSRDKKGKIRIRKKDSDTGGSIVSLTVAQVVCRPVNKQETVTVVVDGVEWEGVSLVRVGASWDHSLAFPLAVCSAVDDT